MDKNNMLFKNNPPDYPEEKYYDHLLDQYKIYLEMADNISNRRQSANSFFLSVNTAIIALVTYLNLGNDTASKYYPIIALAGMIICFAWYRLIRSYKDLNTAKFKVLHEIESRLPVAPYDEEWEKVGRGQDSKLYLPFTHVEILIPWVFFALHAIVLISSIPW
jgi:hypothetical protein